ncbi:hypothetical protein Tco_1391124, partial [Tanacetum coccineum]
QHISEKISRIPGLNEIRNPFDVSLENLQVIPDSLSTLSQYLTRLRQQFNDTVRSQSPGAGVGGQESHAKSSKIFCEEEYLAKVQNANIMYDQAGMLDPPRQDVRNALLSCIIAGICEYVYTLQVDEEIDIYNGWIVTPISLLQNLNQVRPTSLWGVYTKVEIFNMIGYKKGNATVCGK